MTVTVLKPQQDNDPTTVALSVDSATAVDAQPWDRQRVIDSLVAETGLAADKAGKVAEAVEKTILDAKMSRVTTTLLRELVNSRLIEMGFAARQRKSELYGVPGTSIRRMLEEANKENANVPFNPEAVNLYLAENVLRQYALNELYGRDVAAAHLAGDLHIHDLGMAATRPYCSGHSPVYVARYGLSSSVFVNPSGPANHPFVLVDHIKEFTSMMQGCFAGAIGWDVLNTSVAPYLAGLSDAEVLQTAEHLVYGMSQLLGTRGGQVAFTDLNVYWEMPRRMRDVPAVGPGGKFVWREDALGEKPRLSKEADTQKGGGRLYKQHSADVGISDRKGYLTYEDFLPDAQRFAIALLKVYMRGDSNGAPFHFPKIQIHVSDDLFRAKGGREFLEYACAVAAEKGSPYFVFDRDGENKVSQCCRLTVQLDEEDLRMAKEPWRLRFSALQNVSLNLPRAAMRAETYEAFLVRLRELVLLASQAHKDKRKQIQKLLKLKEQGPLRALTVEEDGEAYYKLNRASYLIGVVGLNEAVAALCGEQLHESSAAYELGLRVMADLFLICQSVSAEQGLKLLIEQTPAESTAYRFAKLDLKAMPEQAAKIVRGGADAAYYSNSTYYAPDAPISFVDRISQEGAMHPLIRAGALTHVWLADSKPEPQALLSVVEKTLRLTNNAQIAFSPTFTLCEACHQTSRGMLQKCPKCKSTAIDHVTRVTGYFSKVSSWNPGKRAELADRRSMDQLSEKLPAVAATKYLAEVFGKPGCEICETAWDAVSKVVQPDVVKYWDVTTSEGLVAMMKAGLRDAPGLRIGERTWQTKLPPSYEMARRVEEELKIK